MKLLSISVYPCRTVLNFSIEVLVIFTMFKYLDYVAISYQQFFNYSVQFIAYFS